LPIRPSARMASPRSRGARRFVATVWASELAFGPTAARAAMAALRTSMWESVSRGLIFATLPSAFRWPSPSADALRMPASLLVRPSSRTGVALAAWPLHVDATAATAARLTEGLLLFWAISSALPK